MKRNDFKSGSTASGQNEPARGKRIVLRLIWAEQSISRAELSRRIGFNRSSITEIVKPLISKGLLVEKPLDKEDFEGLGRPPINLSFNDKNDFFIGVNLGVNHSQIGQTNLSSDFSLAEEFETPQDPAKALKLIAEKIRQVWARGETRRLRTIGITVPGPADKTRRELLFAPHLGWENVKISDFLEKELALKKAKIPVIVENNAAASAMYEVRLKLPGDKEIRDYTVIRSGSGIGVGLVIDGEVYHGMGQNKGIAGEFGHMTIMAGGKQCVCGNRGCWEQYASAPAATALYLDNRKMLGQEESIRFSELAQRALVGERRAITTLEKVGEYLGIGIANIMMGFSVSNVIVSGRLVYGWEFLRKPLHEAIRRSIAGKIRNWSVESGEPSGASLGGALEIAVEEFFRNV
jgi:predicted NBD/HSP70 family sugar kinase